MECAFCRRIWDGELVAATDAAVAFADAHPVSDGHTLVAPRAHVEDLFAVDAGTWVAVWSLVRDVQRRLAAEVAAEGWNVGVNAGAAAGQTVAHAHVHLIPRRHGDVADPRGGIRWLLPQRADYWTTR